MREYVIKSNSAYGVALVLAVLTAMNIVLAASYLKQHRQILQLTSPDPGGLATGVTLPALTGIKLATKQPAKILPAGTSAMFLLVYREDCHYCEQNWATWQRLFGSAAMKNAAVLVTRDKVVSSAYEMKHPLLDQNLTLSSLNAEHVGPLNLGLTPQTILLKQGVVDHDWVGVLSPNDVAQISKTIAALR